MNDIDTERDDYDERDFEEVGPYESLCTLYDRTVKELQEEAQIYADMAEYEEDEIRGALEIAIHSTDILADDNYTLTRAEKWAYLLKAAACYALGLRRCKKHGSYPDRLIVAYTYSSQDGYGWSARYLVVGHRAFRNWFVDIETDGDSFY